MRAALVAASVLAMATILAQPALAHVPAIEPPTRVIGEPERSWAFYDELPRGETHVWAFDLTAGDALYLVVSVPLGASWTPTATLRTPAGEMPLDRVDAVTFEPFGSYAARHVWEIQTAAPATGAYSLEVGGEGGRYGLGYGLAEEFTLREWTLIALDVERIRIWAGTPAPLVALPYVAGAMLATAVVFLRRGKDAPALLPARLGAGLLLGTAASRGWHAVAAASAGAHASPAAWVVATLLVLLAAGLAWGAWRARRAWALAAIGVGAFAAWAGVLLAPALLLGAAAAHALGKRRAAKGRGARS